MTTRHLGLYEVEVLATLSKQSGSGIELLTVMNNARVQIKRPTSSVGAIYTTLARLAEKGYVASYVTEPKPIRGGRRIRRYVISDLGHEALKRTMDVYALFDSRGVSNLSSSAPA